VSTGQPVSDTIAAVGEWHDWTLSAQPDQTVVIDMAGECVSDLFWQLLRPDGTLKTFATTCIDSAPVTLDVAGDWTIEIYSNGMATGAYSFVVNPAAVSAAP
jgi:hypothetical protein